MANWASDAFQNTTTAGAKTATLTPAVGDLIVIVTQHSDNVDEVSPTDNNPDGLGTGAAYVLAKSAVKRTSADKLCIWVRKNLIGSNTSTIFTHTPTNSTTGGGIFVERVQGMSKVGTAAIKKVGSQDNQTSGGSPSTSWIGGGSASGTNPLIAAAANAVNGATGFVKPSTFDGTFGRNNGYGTPATGTMVTTDDTGNTDSTVTWTGSGAGQFCHIIVELDASATQQNLTQNCDVGATATPVLVKAPRKPMTLYIRQGDPWPALVKKPTKPAAATSTETPLALKSPRKLAAYGGDTVAVSQNASNVAASLGVSGTPPGARGQSFQLATSGPVDGIEIHIPSRVGTPTDSVLVELVDTDITSGTVLGSATVLVSALIDGQFNRFAFAPVVLLGATTYYIRVSRTGAADGSNFLRVSLNNADVYAGGTLYDATAGVWSTATGDLRFQVITTQGAMVPAMSRTLGKSQLVAATVTLTVALASRVLSKATAVAATCTPANGARAIVRAAYAVSAICTPVLGRAISRAAYAVGVTCTALLTKAVTKTTAVAATCTTALLKTTGKLCAVGVTGTVALRKAVTKAVAVALTVTLALLRSLGHTVAAGVTATPVVLKKVTKTVAVGVTTTLALSMTRLYNILVAVGVTMTPVARRAVTKTVAAGVTCTAALTRALNRALAVGAVCTPALTKLVTRTVAVAATCTPALVRAITKTLAVGVTCTAVLRRVLNRVVAVGVTCTSALVRAVTKTIAVTVTGSTVLLKAVTKLVAYAATMTLDLTKQFTSGLRTVTVDVGVTLVPALTKLVTKTTAVGVTCTSAVGRGLSRTLAVGSSCTVALSRSIARAVAVALTSTVALSGRVLTKTLSLGVTGTVVLRRALVRIFVLSVTATVVLVRSLARSFAVAVTATPAVVKAVTKTLAVAATMALDLTKSVNAGLQTVTVNVATTLAPALAKIVTKTATVGVDSAMTLGRALLKGAAFTGTMGLDLVRGITRVFGLGVEHVLDLIPAFGAGAIDDAGDCTFSLIPDGTGEVRERVRGGGPIGIPQVTEVVRPKPIYDRGDVLIRLIPDGIGIVFDEVANDDDLVMALLGWTVD